MDRLTSFGNFYVKKDIKGIGPVNTTLIKMKNSYSDIHYDVLINYKLYDRLLKINKIIKDKKFDNLIKLVQLCEENKKTWFDVGTDQAVDELAKDINNNILKRLMEMGIQNHNKQNGISI